MKARIKRMSLVVCLFIVIFAFGCGDDDDDSSGPAAVDDDDTVDDDDDNDTADDDDDDNDDNDDNDDDDDDDNDDDDLGPFTYGWILMDTDRDHISEVLGKAADFGIDNIHLSHDLIMDIDQINEDETRAQMLQEIAREAHGLGLSVWVWAHEIYGDHLFLCFDPEDPFWNERAQAYRDALDRIPEIDGVMLMTGSADTEPWYVPCYCDYCRDLPRTGNPIYDLLNTHPADRLKLLFDTVGQVVMDEFGKELRYRTFLHQPFEINWMQEALTTYEDERLKVMSKDVPQDWEPYYPHHPLIGNVGRRHQIIEMDLGNEYWGVSKILNGQVDYIYYRWTYDQAQGARGAAARIERGANHAFGNPNEVNIYAFTRLVADGAEPDDVYREWFEDRYGFTAQSDESDALKEIFRNSHYAMRKMYYTLGMWTLEKGSDVTDSARYPAQLWTRNTAYYDPAWLSTFLSLATPDEQTISDLWQESAESRELAQDNLDLLESIEGSFAEPGDYDELHDLLELHRDCTEVWQLVKDTVFRYDFYVFGHPDQAPYLEWNAGRLLELADAMETRWGAGVSPGNPGRIRNFVDDLRDGFPVQPGPVEWEQTEFFDIRAEDLGGGTYNIQWTSSANTTQGVQWSEELPLYDNDTGEQEVSSASHSVQITVDEPGGRYVYRVYGADTSGNLIRSGDFWVGLDP